MVNSTNSCGAYLFFVVRTTENILVVNFPVEKKYYSYGAITESYGAININPKLPNLNLRDD